jgi:hypothetical protein
MSPQELVHQLMCDIGPAVNAHQVTGSADEGFWQIVFDEDTAFDIQYDATVERIVLSSRVAALQTARRLQVCELLLRVNFGWRETGGVRMALHATSDDVVMMFELPVASLHVSQLSIATEHRPAQSRPQARVVARDHPRFGRHGGRATRPGRASAGRGVGLR